MIALFDHVYEGLCYGIDPDVLQAFAGLPCLAVRHDPSPAVKQQIVDMAMNASGIRDTARVLHVSPTTVINELKQGP